MDCIHLGTPEYPRLLAEISDPPTCIWSRGDRALLSATAVAVIGARAASPEGLIAASEIAFDLARAGIVVVSGLARGIDAAAHRGALDAGGKTIAVLGTGIDRVYPAENERAARRDRIERTAAHRAASRHAAVGMAFSQAQSHHQRPLASGGGRRGTGQERLADHRPFSGGSGPRRHGRARDDRRRPEPRRQRVVEGWGKARGVCGRYPARTRIRTGACLAEARRAEAEAKSAKLLISR